MTIIKTSIKRFVSETTLSMTMIVMLVAAAITPQVVDAQVKTIVHGIDIAYAAKAPSFPVSGEREARRVMSVVATAYSSDPYQTDSTPCLPAMNFDLCEAAEEGVVDTIAANFLPLGTKVRFPELYGDKVFTVRDRMNARYNGTNRIDFYKAQLDADGNVDNVASKQEAIDFGVQRITMEIF